MSRIEFSPKADLPIKPCSLWRHPVDGCTYILLQDKNGDKWVTFSLSKPGATWLRGQAPDSAIVDLVPYTGTVTISN